MIKYKYNYNVGDYVNKKTREGRRLYFAGVDNRFFFDGLPCVFLTTCPACLSDTDFWLRWTPAGIIEKVAEV